MTEEIIINCAFYKDGVCASPINKTCKYCKNIDVSKCYHKQLKRLKQQHNDDTEEIAKLGLDVAILEQENKELKEYSKRMENQRENYYKEYNKYRSALEKIRNLVRGHKIADEVRLKSILDKINEVLE